MDPRPPPLSVVLFSGSGAIGGLIRSVQRLACSDRSWGARYGWWTHVGVCVTSAMLPSFAPRLAAAADEPLVLEMAKTGRLANDLTPDLITGRCRLGVQVRRLRDVLTTYDGDVAYAPLTRSPWDARPHESKRALRRRRRRVTRTVDAFLRAHRDDAYQLNPLRLLSGAIRGMRPFRRFFSLGERWTCCSELTAGLYKDLGVAPSTTRCVDVTPQDFIHDDDRVDGLPDGLFQLPVTSLS